MIINRLSDKENGELESEETYRDDCHEYQTADELFELMAKNYDLETNQNECLTAGDLVLLYKNIDLGTQLMTNANELKRKVPNQYVETVIHNEEEDSDSSEISDIYSTEDFRNIITVNEERMAFLCNQSLENMVSHKLGEIQIQPQNISFRNGNDIKFKKTVKDHFRAFNLASCSDMYDDTVLPTSLLDYMCCKRLEDNYDIYMDSIITYVKHTIEQLKRISNGDYLTDKAKEKWREVENFVNKCKNNDDNSNVIALSTSIPFYFERKVDNDLNTWNDVVRSEIDVRNLSKILQKRIVFQIPKLISGTFKLFNKRNVNNVAIRYKRRIHTKESVSNIDLLLHLKRSESGYIVNNISSIIMLNSVPKEFGKSKTLLLKANEGQSKEEANETSKKCLSRVTELINLNNYSSHSQEIKMNTEKSAKALLKSDFNQTFNHQLFQCDNIKHLTGCSDIGSDFKSTNFVVEKSLNSESTLADTLRIEPPNAMPLNDLTPTKLGFPLVGASDNKIRNKDVIVKQPLNLECSVTNTINVEIQNALIDLTPTELGAEEQKLKIYSLPEESGDDIQLFTTNKKKMSSIIRIKSPYENRRYLMDEKKRKRLLEIRERRDKKKMIMNEHSKVTRLKHGRVPRASNSITNLSISNKSFYNSIYGSATIIGKKQRKTKSPKKLKKNCTTKISLMYFEDLSNTSKINGCIGNNQDQDDSNAVSGKDTEEKGNHNNNSVLSDDASNISSDFKTLLTECMRPSLYSINQNTSNEKKSRLDAALITKGNNLKNGTIEKNVVSKNMSKDSSRIHKTNNVSKKLVTSVACRKDIDKIYNLIKPRQNQDLEGSKRKDFKSIKINEQRNTITEKDSFILPSSESGTSVKHHRISSNPSSNSFDQRKDTKIPKHSFSYSKKEENLRSYPPKVTINSKTQMSADDYRKETFGRKSIATANRATDPLKTITDLLQVFDNVQKTKHKTGVEVKPTKKTESNILGNKYNARPGFKISKLSDHQYNYDGPLIERPTRKNTVKDKIPKPITEIIKLNHQKPNLIERNAGVIKRKVDDIIDEVKEARGEAVRGPKQNSRIWDLAQPKRSYVQAHSQEYQVKHGRKLVTDKVQKLSVTTSPPLEKIQDYLSPKSKPLRLPLETIIVAARPQFAVSTSERILQRKGAPAITSNWNTFKPLGPNPLNKLNNINVPISPKKKSVAVEPFAKVSMRCASQPLGDIRSHQNGRSRIPQLHKQIGSVSKYSPNIYEDEAMRLEGNYDPYKGTRKNIFENSICTKIPTCIREDIEDLSVCDGLSKTEEPPSTDSDYNVDVFKDKNVLTAVENMSEDNYSENVKETISEDNKITDSLVQSLDSEREIENLENNLFHQISIGASQSRLRIKNITLTPQHSMQEILLLQSGDTKSMLTEPNLPQNLKITASVAEASKVSVLSNSYLDLKFTHFPMQIATVGYAFSKLLLPTNSETYSNSNTTYVINSKSCFSVNKKPSKHIHSEKKRFNNELKISTPNLELKHRPQNLHISKEGNGILHNVTNNKDSISKVLHVTKNIQSKDEVMDSKETGTSIKTHIICNKFNTMGNMESTHSLPNNNFQDNKNDATLNIYSKNISFQQNCELKNKAQNQGMHPDELLLNTEPDLMLTLLECAKNEADHSPNTANVTKNTEKIGESTAESSEILKDDTDSEKMEYTNSLDILVGLLNEIQNITSRQNHITKEAAHNTAQGTVNNQQIQNLDIIQRTKKNKLMYLDKLKPFKSNPDLYSFDISNAVVTKIIPGYADNMKVWELNKIGQTKQKQQIDTFTDVPSQLFETVDNSTNITASFLQVPYTPFNEPGAFFKEYQTIYSNLKYDSCESLLYIPQLTVKDNSNKLLSSNHQTHEKACRKHKVINNNSTTKDISKEHEDVKTNNKMDKKINKYFVDSDESPDIIKMKRDILVTVYSLLVFTVFAALSFPDLMYRF